jgi:hypothetical protein
MKMSSQDRIQATQNSKVYQKDYQRYEKQREKDGEVDVTVGPPWEPCRNQSMAGKRLCKKWGLNRPISPDAPLEPLDCSTGKPSTDWLEWMVEGAVYPVTFPTEDELKMPTSVTNSTHYDVTHLNGKLCLLIDTSWPLDMIMDVLREFITHYAKENKGTLKKTEEDPWEIYEMYRRTKNLLEINRERYEISELPAYDVDADKYYQRIKRAYKKALKMIDYVEKEAKKQKRLPK